MDQCIFCKIVKGEIDSVRIYEDDRVVAFLDVNPVSRGHALVIPKQHFQDTFDIPEDDAKSVMAAGRKIAQKMRDSLNTDGINFLQSNGKVAGQVIFHYHLHVIPRYGDDGLKTRGFFGEREERADREELKQLAEKLRI